MNIKKSIAKKGILLLVLVAAGKCSTAQRLDIFGGVNLTTLSHKIADKSQDNSGNVNFNAGMGVFVPFKPKKNKDAEAGGGLFPSLQFVGKGTSKSTIVNPIQADIKLNFLQLNLPLTYMAGNYGIGIGPYAAYAVSGSKKFRTGSNTDKQSIDFTNDIKRFDYGLSVHMILSVFKIQYDLGLANMSNFSNASVKTRSFSLSLEIPLVMN